MLTVKTTVSAISAMIGMRILNLLAN